MTDETTTEESFELEPLDEDGVRALALDVVRGNVCIRFVWGDLAEFEMLLFMSEGKMLDAPVGALYEEWSKAGPMAVNGRARFFGCHLLHIDSVMPLLDKIGELEDAMGLTGDERFVPEDFDDEGRAVIEEGIVAICELGSVMAVARAKAEAMEAEGDDSD